MTRRRQEGIYIAATMLAAISAQAVWAATPFIFVWPALLAYTVQPAIWILLGVSMAAELFSAHTGGIVLAVMLVPFIVRQILAGIPVDLSIAFFTLVAGTLALQFVLLFAPDMWWAAIQTGSISSGFRAALAVVPWQMLPRLIISAVLIYTLTVLVYFNRTW